MRAKRRPAVRPAQVVVISEGSGYPEVMIDGDPFPFHIDPDEVEVTRDGKGAALLVRIPVSTRIELRQALRVVHLFAPDPPELKWGTGAKA